ncbi:RicAFT regulatory complex protein RicA family protein [Paenibacillus spongiae]|uniref:YlbF family regulator n=1 Tax=Paenibacillus spongiae TaxID=2909671 RepID=A0ABY5SFD3_9BACL|nr:YlbF family regulator [Paenibacillus spongiae]UVI30973.1 YlbF family regulator [Paenibacillus spongiae]
MSATKPINAHSHDYDHENCHHNEEDVIPRFDNRVIFVREDILARTRELAHLITTTEEVSLYQKSEELVQGHEKIQGLIAKIKKKQKELVAFQNAFKNKAMVDKIEQEISVLQDELDEIPVVQQFQQSQTDVNYLLQLIVSFIRDVVAEKLDLEAAVKAEAPEKCD